MTEITRTAGTRENRAARQPHARKIAFVSQHCILDFTNGAATATATGPRRFKLMRKSAGSRGTGHPPNDESSECEFGPSIVTSIAVEVQYGKC